MTKITGWHLKLLDCAAVWEILNTPLSSRETLVHFSFIQHVINVKSSKFLLPKWVNTYHQFGFPQLLFFASIGFDLALFNQLFFHENEENWTGRVRPKLYYVDPPLVTEIN